MTEELKQEEKVEEVSPEQQEANVEMKRLQEYLREVVKSLFAEGFKMYALDSASDIFKSLMIIQGSKTKEWNDKVQAGRKIDDDFYSLNSKDLHYVESTAKNDEEVKE